MLITNQYIYEEKSFLKSLIEVAEYCNKNSMDLTRIKEGENVYEFSLDFGKDVAANLTVLKEKTLGERELVTVNLALFAKHRTVTDKVTGTVKGAGKIVGGLGGIIGSVLTPGVGWILGSVITTVTYNLGSIPGRILGGIDDGLSNVIIKPCEKHLSAILNLFHDNLVNLTEIYDKNEIYKEDWISQYLLDHPDHYIYSYPVEKKTGILGKTEHKVINFNSFIEKGKNVYFCKEYSPWIQNAIYEIKKKKFEKDKIITNKENVQEIEYQWMSFCVDPIYDEEYKKRYSIESDERSSEELKKELRKLLKY